MLLSVESGGKCRTTSETRPNRGRKISPKLYLERFVRFCRPLLPVLAKQRPRVQKHSLNRAVSISHSSVHTMQANEQVDVIIYRVSDNGLEVFLVNPNTLSELDGELWQAPVAGEGAPERLSNCIELDAVMSLNGESRKAIAVEADWHEIPSLRALIYEDYRVAKEKAKQHIKNFLPDIEKGTFVAVKEAFKRVMPEQYAFLKELKDIVAEKNQTKYL